MKYITGKNLTDFLKEETKNTKKARAFVANFYGTGLIDDGDRVLPVFETVDEIFSWENPQNEFSLKTLDAVLNICAESTGLNKEEVVKRLENAFIYGDFLENLEETLSSIKLLLGTRIESQKRKEMFDSAKQVDIHDTSLVRLPSSNPKANDDILYIMADEDSAKKVVQEMKRNKELQTTDALYVSSLAKQKD